jgi:hypothetical protein
MVLLFEEIPHWIRGLGLQGMKITPTIMGKVPSVEWSWDWSLVDGKLSC